jgi:hypothetical protein
MAAKKKVSKKRATKKVAKKASKKVAKKAATPKPKPSPPPVVEEVKEPISVAEDNDVEVTAPSIPQVITNLEDLNKKKLQEVALTWPLKEKGANPLPDLSVKLYVLDWEKGTVAIKGTSEEQVKAALYVLHVDNE